MKVAAHTLVFPDTQLAPAIDLSASLGFQGIEILVDPEYPCAIPPRASSAALDALRAHLSDAPLPCVHVTPYVRTLDHRDASVRRAGIAEAEDAIRIAAALGAGGVRVLAGRREAPHLAERFALFVASMRALAAVAAVAAPAGVSLNIETKGWSFASDGPSMLTLLRAIDEPAVGILLDPANATIDGLDAVADLHDQLPHVRQVHFKDTRRTPDGPWIPCRAGSGSVPWDGIVERLQRAGFTGFVSLEYEKRWHPDALPSAALGLPHERAYLHSRLGRATERPSS